MTHPTYPGIAEHRLSGAIPIIVFWANQGHCTCKIADFMNTDPAWKGISVNQVTNIARANRIVCPPCDEQENEAYMLTFQQPVDLNNPKSPTVTQTVKLPKNFNEVMIDAIDNEAAKKGRKRNV